MCIFGHCLSVLSEFCLSVVCFGLDETCNSESVGVVLPGNE